MTDSPLLTDLYQFTMAYGYWRLKRHEERATFHHLFRKNPFDGRYALCCGLDRIIEFINQWQFSEEDLAYLSHLKNSAKQPLFEEEFIDYLRHLTFSCNIDAIPEGTIVFPHEPLLRIEGPLLQCQLLESPLLNLINFQTLIATKAQRVCRAAGSDPVIEFGLRRAQGSDGALSASRAAYIGGCVATSNTLAGRLYDIPVSGTQAHSWISSFDSEKEAFLAYASVMPTDCVLLVDTYDTIQGVKNAILTAEKLHEMGGELKAIRLDSGEMASLSRKARQLLDEAGLQNTKILASNSLDENVIKNLKQQGAAISAWGVGTHLTTAYDQPALDGVYKLSAMQNKQGEWEYKLKLSEDAAKTSNPGRHQVRRFFSGEHYILDVIYDLSLGISDTPEAVLIESNQQKKCDDIDGFVDLLTPIYREGRLVHVRRTIHEIRDAAIMAAKEFYQQPSDVAYPVGLEKRLHEKKQFLIKKMKSE